MTSKATFLIVCSLWIASLIVAQEPGRKQVKLIHADDIFFDKALVDAQRLIGNVQLLYGETNFLCDSAYLYANQNFDAFGRIRVSKGSEYSVTGDKLFFDKAAQQAKITGNVRLNDREMTLTSNDVRYNIHTGIAYYNGGGRIISHHNSNVLTSHRGSYASDSQTFNFREDVVLKNPEYTVLCDTLRYDESNAIAYFLGPTTITSADTKIYCENGWYNTLTDICQFNENARIISEKTILTGDSIFYDSKKGFGEAFRNITLRDTSSNFLISGDYGRHSRQLNESLVTQHALLIQYSEGDTLFLSADTLMARQDTSKNRLIRAFHHVRIFRNDLQGLSDSLTYTQSDSMINMFHDPVLWSESSQITGDSIRINTWNGHIEKLIVRGNSFIVSDALSADTLNRLPDRYNQIKGRNIDGYFQNNELRRVYIKGNAQLAYFPLDEKGDTATLIGLNKGESSDIAISITNNQIRKINLIREPDSVFSPLNLIKDDDFELEGFEWRGGERPVREGFGR